MAPDAATFQARFEEDYTKLFGRRVAGMDVEITVWSVNATTPPEPVAPVAAMPGDGVASPIGSRQLFDPASAQYLEAQVVQRADMTVGQCAAGPAAVTEAETTIIVPASREAIRQPDGCIDVLLRRSETSQTVKGAAE